MPEVLGATLQRASAVLFDFDGPICDVFVGVPAHQLARDLAGLAEEHDPALSVKLTETSDPMEVLRITFAANKELGLQIETALTKAEVEAVGVAGAPTQGAGISLAAARASGWRVAVVSNNSAECVAEFLARHDLDRHVEEIVGRPVHRPDLMKPSPHSLLKAAELLDVEPSACVLIGDSLTDIQAAHLASSTAIGYANKPHKRQAFIEAGADAVTDDMEAIATAMR